MIKVESSVKEINKNAAEVFGFLSNLKNLEAYVPKDKLKNFHADENSCSFQVDMLGDTTISIVEKVPFKTIQFSGGEAGSFPFKFWVQLKESGSSCTQMKLTLHAGVNLMMKMIIEPLLKNGINMIADKITEVLNAPSK